jgi:hypothetical protein
MKLPHFLKSLVPSLGVIILVLSGVIFVLSGVLFAASLIICRKAKALQKGEKHSVKVINTV